MTLWPENDDPREHHDDVGVSVTLRGSANLQVCRDAMAAAPCYPGTFTGSCKTYDKSNCGVQYSDQGNAAYCAIDTPSTWPPLLQVRFSIFSKFIAISSKLHRR